MKDDPVRLKEMEEEERSAKSFGISIEQLRKQRKSLGQLLTGPYQGCSPEFADLMERMKQVDSLFKEINHETV
jgi:uncharacterized protein YdcH (DUF465 family)